MHERPVSASCTRSEHAQRPQAASMMIPWTLSQAFAPCARTLPGSGYHHQSLHTNALSHYCVLVIKPTPCQAVCHLSPAGQAPHFSSDCISGVAFADDGRQVLANYLGE